jgi:threonine/homoserine/homoserine lactone efflux protein
VTLVGTQHLELFVLSGILLNITPGQDTLYIAGHSVSQGRRAGLLSVLGIVCGSIVHTLAAAFGLSAILVTSAHAFVAVKIAGAIYLGYLGAQMLFAKPGHGPVAQEFALEGDWTVFRAGLLTNVLNPKVALFFLAFLPQFVAPESESRILSLLFLGGVFIFNGTLWCLFLVWSASAVSRRLRTRENAGLLFKRATGALFVGLGVRLAVSR